MNPMQPTFKRYKIGLIVIIVLMFSVVSLQVGLLVSQHEPWNPLGNYPEQIVTSRVSGINGPAVHTTRKLFVTGTKCNNTDKEVAIRGSTFWQAVNPDGTNTGIIIPGFIGVGIRPPGCITRHFNNLIPLDVVIAVNAGIKLWILSGSDVPVRPSGTGVPHLWRTQPFMIIP